ncbi:glycoside hydrolase family protein [Sodalis glossinidius]|uniref:glycoside hydrolase family protein n=1 Tax=Sodalis glossinidius TaxID=63612 RepID=UPI0002F19383|nr:glycoside hydrolase family protein [Sodalis glossinidius]
MCYGHTGGDITPETTKTPAQCEALLAADMRQAFAVIDQHVTVPLSDGQRVALAAFIHNGGLCALAPAKAHQCRRPAMSFVAGSR